MPPLPPWSLVEPKLLWLALPALLAAPAVFLLRRLCARRGIGRSDCLPALALLAGLAAGNWLAGAPPRTLREHPPLIAWWPAAAEGETLSATGWGWLLIATAAMTAGACLAAVLRDRIHPTAAAVIRLLIVLGCCRLVTEAGDSLLRPWLTAGGIPEAWLLPPESPALRTGTWLALSAVVWLDWETLRRFWQPPLIRAPAFLLATFWAVPASALIILSHSARLADLAVLLAAALSGVCLGRLFGGTTHRAAASEPVELAAAAFYLPALLLAAGQNSYSSVPIGGYALAALVPAALWLLSLPVLKSRPAWVRTCVAVVLLLLPSAIAVVWALQFEQFEFGEQW